MTLPWLPVLTALALLLGGCEAITGTGGAGDERRVLGTINLFGDSLHLEAPARVQRGSDVPVVVATYGNGCYRQGDTEVVGDGRTVRISPYDYTAPPGTPCTDILQIFRHEVVIAAGEAGTLTLIIRGRHSPSDEVVLIPRTLVVE